MSDERLDQWIDGLLTSEEALPTAPASLRGKVQRARSRKRRNAWVLRGIATAAALGAVIFVSGDRKVVQMPATAPSPPPVATFVGRSDLIVVPLKSTDPTVTIVQVYPTTITQRRWHREAALRAALTNTQSKQETPVRGG